MLPRSLTASGKQQAEAQILGGWPDTRTGETGSASHSCERKQLHAATSAVTLPCAYFRPCDFRKAMAESEKWSKQIKAGMMMDTD